MWGTSELNKREGQGSVLKEKELRKEHGEKTSCIVP